MLSMDVIGQQIYYSAWKRGRDASTAARDRRLEVTASGRWEASALDPKTSEGPGRGQTPRGVSMKVR